MYAHWPTTARAHIAAAVKDLPADAPLHDRQKALRRAAGDFHHGTSHGRKVWSREARAYLEEHGLPPLERLSASRTSSRHQARVVQRQAKRLDAGDITYPFRGSADA